MESDSAVTPPHPASIEDRLALLKRRHKAVLRLIAALEEYRDVEEAMYPRTLGRELRRPLAPAA